MERLQKIIAASGIASRRKAEELILAGKVRVNGKVVRTLGSLAAETDSILVDGKALPKPQLVTYLLNKPRGVVSSRSQQKNERIITELVPPFPPVYPVGRLDKESEGLILLTNDGALAQRLTHPSYEHTKTYEVLGKAEATSFNLESVLARLKKGVRLGDGHAAADTAEGKVLPTGRIKLVLSVHEGRTHLIRRLCATVGIKVTRLTRVKIGTIGLGNLRSGQYRLLSAAELRSLQ